MREKLKLITFHQRVTLKKKMSWGGDIVVIAGRWSCKNKMIKGKGYLFWHTGVNICVKEGTNIAVNHAESWMKCIRWENIYQRV